MLTAAPLITTAPTPVQNQGLLVMLFSSPLAALEGSLGGGGKSALVDVFLGGAVRSAGVEGLSRGFVALGVTDALGVVLGGVTCGLTGGTGGVRRGAAATAAFFSRSSFAALSASLIGW